MSGWIQAIANMLTVVLVAIQTFRGPPRDGGKHRK